MVEIVDMIANVAAVPSKGRPTPFRAKLLKLARTEPEVESRLFCIEERAPLLRPLRPADLVIKHRLPPSEPFHALVAKVALDAEART